MNESDDYDSIADVWASRDYCFEVIRERMRNGGAGWIPRMSYQRKEVLAEGVELYLADCRDLLPGLPKVDAVVTDPPYGIGVHQIGVRSGTPSGRMGRMAVTDYGEIDWDEEPIDAAILALVRAAGRWCIVFGGNYYDAPAASCWLVWDKLNSGDFADCELAWTNLPKAVRRIQYHWNGCMRKERDVPREHPTQKPVGVMKWAIEHLPPDAQTIIDPMMGSGTTGVAAVKLGRKFIGIERIPSYYEIALKRVSHALSEPDLFIESPPPVPKQEKLAL